MNSSPSSIHRWVNAGVRKYLFVALRFFFSILRWVNRKDPSGTNIFGGGFLGLDNIGKDTCSIHLSE